METKDGLVYLEETALVTKLESFMIFGGESMLYPERTIRLFRKANALGIPVIELITNGFWGQDKNRAKRLAIKLKEAGVNYVSLSVDAFHLPYIPLEWPSNAALASLAAGIEKVIWNVAVIESREGSNEFDCKTSQILTTLAALPLEAHFNRVLPEGRARTTLTQFFPEQSLEGTCPEAETTLKNPACVTLDCGGWASICWNLSIGNARKERLSKLLVDYNWKDHPVIETLVESGPKGLLKLSDSTGFQFKEGNYIDKCHLCIEVRRFLKPKYPEMFADA
jgi:hypothetical protein